MAKTTEQTKTLKHSKYSKDLLSYSQLLKYEFTSMLLSLTVPHIKEA